MMGIKGNTANNVGYSCSQRELIKGWRKIWSKTPGTAGIHTTQTRHMLMRTAFLIALFSCLLLLDPAAPSGVVTLASSGSEGGPNMGAMRQAQTAGYGVLPAPDMPNTFLAQAS